LVEPRWLRRPSFLHQQIRAANLVLIEEQRRIEVPLGFVEGPITRFESSSDGHMDYVTKSICG
ncbi:hypothetical protein, partial [Paraburkholderia mimosarum]|uniref:hypothetical protein n=1 Tax=Paraburkholderia mimosarum TaxID=312026 RepID=UPI001EE39F11